MRRVTLRILILQSRDGVARSIVDLHVVITVHGYSICACEIADFAPKNSSDLHLSRGPPRRRRGGGVLEPPQPPPPGYAPGVRVCACVCVNLINSHAIAVGGNQTTSCASQNTPLAHTIRMQTG